MTNNNTNSENVIEIASSLVDPSNMKIGDETVITTVTS